MCCTTYCISCTMPCHIQLIPFTIYWVTTPSCPEKEVLVTGLCHWVTLLLVLIANYNPKVYLCFHGSAKTRVPRVNILETIAGWFHRSYGNRVIIIKGIIWYIIFGLFYALFMTDTVRVRQEGIQGVSLNGTHSTWWATGAISTVFPQPLAQDSSWNQLIGIWCLGDCWFIDIWWLLRLLIQRFKWS